MLNDGGLLWDGNERKKMRKERIKIISTSLQTFSFPHPRVGHKQHRNHNLNETSLKCGATELNIPLETELWSAKKLLVQYSWMTMAIN